MRPVRVSSFVAAIAASLLFGSRSPADERVLMSLPFFAPDATHRIVSVDPAKREARIEPGQPFFFQSSEGLALLVVAAREGGPMDTAVRVEVTEILEDGSVLATFGPGAVSALRKGPALLGRPIRGEMGVDAPPTAVTTRALRELPDVVRPAAATGTADGRTLDLRAAARRTVSMNNLKQLALAFHNYADAYGRFPPAAIVGPDGRPWHSWRVLLLPFLEKNDLAEKYDFSEPWDSPRNLPLAEQVVDLYRDPAREGQPDGFTDYAAIVGEHTLFPPGQVKMKDADDYPACLARARKFSFQKVTDGTSNTILFATLDPARRIPWTKPEDILFGDDFPGIGAPAGIGAIHPVGEERVALAALADGSVRALPASAPRATVDALVTRDGGEIVEYDAIEVPNAGLADRGPPLLRIVRGDDGTLRVESD